MSESPFPPSSSAVSRRTPVGERWRYAVIGACLGAAATLFASAVYPSRPAAAIPPDLARDLAAATAVAPSTPAPATLSASAPETPACGTTVPCPPSATPSGLDSVRPTPDVSMRR